MKKTALFIMMILLSNSTFASSKSDSVKTYYKLINQAELAIVDSNYAIAHKKYDTAFQYKFPNDKDLENALIIACKVMDTVKATRYITEMASLGFYQYNYTRATRPGDFLPYDLDSAFIQSINKQCHSLSELAKTSSLPANLHRWAILYAADQDSRNIEFKDKTDEIQAGRLTDSIIAALMKVFLRDGNFPSYQRTGYFFDGEGMLTNRPGEPFFILYWHQRGKDDPELDSLVLKTVYNGDFRPDLWVTCNRMRKNISQLLGLDIRNRKLESYSKLELDEVNRNREKYLLEPLEDFYKKAAFQQRKLKDTYNPYFRFYNNFLFTPTSK